MNDDVMVKNFITLGINFLKYQDLEENIAPTAPQNRSDGYLKINLKADWLVVGDIFKMALEEFENTHGKK